MNSVCFNCVTYRWPTEGVPVFRCKKCKFAYYCSPQCQEEHWVKVHKKQCKTLAGKVEVPVSTHLPDSCLGCKEEKELGTKKLNSQDCPAWGCLIEPKNTKCIVSMGEFPSAVELGEMARKFSTRAEHTVYIMQLIINKLTRTKSRLAKECKAEMTSMAEFLAMKKDLFTTNEHIFPTNMETTRASCINWSKELNEAGFPAISTISSKLGTKAGDPFCAWETFKLLAGFFRFMVVEIVYHKHFDNLNMKEELPREMKKLFDQRGTYTQFEEMWDKVLAALESGLVDHSNLVEIVCGGSRHQGCGHCKKSVLIEQIRYFKGEEDMIKKPFVSFRPRVFTCLEKDCRLANINQADNTITQTSVVMMSKVSALETENTCDYCYIIGEKVHRCSECMTKVYCSEECQLLDWNLVHGKICNKGEEVHLARKVKGGKKQRESEGKKKSLETRLAAGDSPLDPATTQRCLDIIEQNK